MGALVGSPPGVTRGAVEGAADALYLVAVSHGGNHVVNCRDMVRGFAVDVDGLTGDQAGDFQAEMHGCLCVDCFSIRHKKSPGEGACGSSATEHVIEQSLTGALALCFNAQAVALDLDSIEAGLDIFQLALKLATLVAECGGSLFEFRHFLREGHELCLFDELIVGDGGGEWNSPCATSGFGYAGDQDPVHMLRMTLLVILPHPESFGIGASGVDSGEPLTLAVPTDLKLEEVLHWAVCLMNLV